MRLGLVGLPVSGKSTLFSLLTGAPAQPPAAGRVGTQTGVASLADSRLEALSQLYRPRKTTPVQIAFGDVSGMGEDGRISAQLAGALAPWDGLLAVLRDFESDQAAEPADPGRDLARIGGELILHDLLRVEARLERLPEERQKGTRPREELDREGALFERLAEALRAGRALRSVSLGAAERQALAAYNLLSLKPLLAVLNVEEGKSTQSQETGLNWVALHGKLELELAQLPEAEARAFRTELARLSSGPAELLQACLDLLEQLTFFTVSEPEVKGWPLARGATALEAAGVIHSDLARGFIRAEVIAWDELVELGGLAEARQAGRLRVEGRDYPVREGEVIYIRFNV